MSENIKKEPWENYQVLLKYQQSNLNLTGETYLWFLLLKAQSENLLYFYDDFSNTVHQAQQLINIQTPVEITSLLNAYAGLIAQRNGSYKEAINLFESSIVLAKSKNLNTTFILAKQELAYTRSLTNSYHASLLEIQEAYEQAQKIDNTFLIAMLDETYGAIYGYMGKYEQSITFYQQALNGYQKLDYRPYIAEAVYGMASTYRYWGKYDLAVNYFEQYIDKTSYTPNKDVTFFGVYGLGMTLAERGSCNGAIKVIDKALTLNGQKDYDAELYKRKASCFIQLKQFDLAEKSLLKAKSIFDNMPEIKGTRWQLETLKIEAELANAVGNHSRAYSLISEYYGKHTKTLTDNSLVRLSNLRSRYDIERRDVKIALLEQQYKISVFERYLLIFSIILVIVILVAFIIQRRYTNKVVALSIRDPLSGLFNRRYIFQLLDKLTKAFSIKKGNLSIIILDIDNFKRINDQYGHPFGDQVIQVIADISQSTLRVEDTMGRIGGEEFLCVLPRVDSEICLRIAKRMSESIAKHIFTDDNGDSFFVTISIGISTTSSECLSTEILFLQADKALYHSKKTGKNRITFFDDIKQG